MSTKEQIENLYESKKQVTNFECGFDPVLLIKISNKLFGAGIARLGSRPLISTLMNSYGYSHSKVFSKKMLSLKDDEFIYFLNYINKWNDIITDSTYLRDNNYYIRYTLKRYNENLLNILSDNYKRFEPFISEEDKLKYLLLGNNE